MFDDYTTESHERRIVRCISCNARIIFLPTNTGKQMPTDADSVEPDDDEYDHKKHVTHFSTCTYPDRHRKSR